MLIEEWSEAKRSEWDQWVSDLPEPSKTLAISFPPDRLWRIKSSGHRGTIESYSDDGTITLAVTGQYNRIMFGRKVFGLKPDDIEECDLPGPNEDVGDTSKEAGYSEDDVRNILIPRLIELRKLGKLVATATREH